MTKWEQTEERVREARWNIEKVVPFIEEHIDDFHKWDDDSKGEIISAAYDSLDNLKYLLSCIVDRNDPDKMTDV